MTKLLDGIRSNSASWESIQVVFVVSTGRTATKFFSGFFDDHFEHIVARHEPAPDLFDLGVRYRRNQCSHRQAINRLKKYRYPIYRQVRAAGAPIYLESNNNAALVLPVIRDAFPNRKLVFVTRDPKSYLISSYSKIHGNPGYTLYGEHDPRPRLRASDFEGDPLGDRWADLSRFEKLCWHWKKYNQLISDHLHDEACHITLKYEDLFEASQTDAIRTLMAFVGVEDAKAPDSDQLQRLLSKKSNETDRYQLPAFEAWDSPLKRHYYDILGDDLEKYGYS